MRKIKKIFRKQRPADGQSDVPTVPLSLSGLSANSDFSHTNLTTNSSSAFLPSLTLEDRKTEPTGLFPVAEGHPATGQQTQYPVDIVAVHGLNGDAETTWTHPNGTFWLRDLLPDLLPGCGVFTYGYPSKIFLNHSLAGVKDFSRHLLDRLRYMYETGQVCHGTKLFLLGWLADNLNDTEPAPDHYH